MRSVPRALDPARDRTKLFDLWDLTIGTQWPVHSDALMAATPLGYVFETVERFIGAIAFDETGAISYVIVDPSWRRQGIGRALYDAVVAHFAIDPQVVARATAAGVKFGFARKGDAKDVIEYESREHPVWVPYFRSRFPEEAGSVLLARDRNGAVVGALLIDLPPRHRGRWSRILGEDMAEIGCVGVAASVNGQGIGTALVAEATEIVKKAGAPVAYLAWTSRVTFYGRLGYIVWRDYREGSRPAV